MHRIELGWQLLALGDDAAAKRILAVEVGKNAQADVLALVAAGDLAGARAKVDALDERALPRRMLEVVVAHAEGRWDEVVRVYHLHAVDGARLEVGYLAADAMERAGRPDDAEQLFRRIAEQPMSWIGPIVATEAWDRIGALRERAGDSAAAIAAYRTITERWPRADVELAPLRHARERLRSLNGPARPD
jgi:hypothetical protein